MPEIELVPQSSMRRELIERLAVHDKEKIAYSQQADYEADGWVVDKKLVKQVWMLKPKEDHSIFEGQVWAMCARLGFKSLSGGTDVRIQYGKHPNEHKKVHLVAADDDVVLAVLCKSSTSEQSPTYSFSSEISQIQNNRDGLMGTLRLQFPERKIKFVLATNNINVTKHTLERLQESGIAYLDEESISYYHELANHLGDAAKFQLLGSLFQGQQISAMDSRVSAIQGKMGGHTYFSFAIEPERLLKVAYVLHRNNANMRWMPTYQRIIKKSRLRKVSQFVSNGGFFPNSLVINIDNGGKKLKFDRSDKQAGSTALGILHLPRKYRSAYVIDGQHRLYGFAHSHRADTELVPVVAFVDLPGEKQLELFMQINENQQAVPKNLQNTLNADLLWTSPDPRKQAQALKLKVAQLLGEQKTSPLRGRVIIGEDQANDKQCISLDAIQRGIDRGRFIGEFGSSGPRKLGSFYRTNNDDTYIPLIDFLQYCFEFIRKELPHQWKIGRGDGGFVFTNPGTEAILRLIGDIVDYLVILEIVDPHKNSPQEVFDKVAVVLGHLTEYLVKISHDDASEYRGWLGSGAPTKYHRRFQFAVHQKLNDFSPDGLLEWIEDQEQRFNTESFSMIRAIEKHLSADIRSRLEAKFGDDWYRAGVPKKVYSEAKTMEASKQYDSSAGVVVHWWDCLYLIHYREILTHGNMSLWNELYNDAYTILRDRKTSSWKDKSAWLVELNDVRNKVSHNSTVSETEYDFLRTIHSHFQLSSLS